MVDTDLEVSSDVQRARARYERRQWADAAEALLRAQRTAPLRCEDLERLAWSAALIGNDDEFLRALELVHKIRAEAGDSRKAANAAFWIGFRLLSIGAPGRAMGWLARAQRYVEGEGDDCAECGYLLLPKIFQHLGNSEDVAAERAAGEAADIGERCGDGDLIAIARNLQGRAVLRQGRVDAGLALLDEVMVTVTSGELSPVVTGIVYCNVLVTCQQACAFDRAREWTAALASWCEQQSQLITFTGNCLVHRSEIMQLGGDWTQALEEVGQLCEQMRRDPDPEVFADACYQRGELFRLQGEFDKAEAAYQAANQNGRDPQPGLALLRLAQGRRAEAVSAIDRVTATTTPAWQRARVLPAFVEIMLAADELDAARMGADELETIARNFGTRILGAMAANARGAVRLAGGDPHGAIELLRYAFDVWHRAGAPYIAARIRVLLATAYRLLGDQDGAALEVDAAGKVFAQLGAEPDLKAVDSARELARELARESARESTGEKRGGSAHGLSPRELEVLRLVASGRTNKAIAAQLSLSERTIDRHVSNIFSKIDVPSRAAATAFAYKHHLV